MATLLFIDSAFPLGHVVSGVDGVAFYCGGDTPHVWSKAEIAAQPYRYRLPIWVRSNPPGPGAAADARACLAQLAAIGAPKGTLVALDVETAVDASYVRAFYAALRAGGYVLIVYASQSFIAGQGNPDGLYWGAQWTGAPHIAAGDAMTQYVDFGGYDESEATTALPFWDTRSSAPPPPPPPPSGSPWPLSAGSNGPDVVTLQGNLNRWRYAVPPLATDGMFGPATLAAVRHAQSVLGMPVTGIVDEALWKALSATLPPPAAFPVPTGTSAHVMPTVLVSWTAGTPLSPHWRVQVAADAGGKPGAVLPGGSVVTTEPHVTITLPAPGRYWYRVQAAGNSPFTAWRDFSA